MMKINLTITINSTPHLFQIELRNYQPEELEYWAELEHPNLVKLYGAIRVKHKIYIFSEFYAAGSSKKPNEILFRLICVI